MDKFSPDPSSGRSSTVSSRFLQQSTFHSVLQIPPTDELLPYPPDFSNNELLQSSIELLQMLSGLHYQSIFYNDRLLSESLPNFLLSRSTLLRASSGLRQCLGFSSSRTSTKTNLHPSFYNKRSPSGLPRQPVSIRTLQ